MCPWFIAVYGKHFTQRGVADVATEMLEEVIVRHDIDATYTSLVKF